MNTNTAMLLAAALLGAPATLLSQDMPPGDVVYEENFDHAGATPSLQGWFSFSAGSEAAAKAAVEPSVGVDGSWGLVFRFSGANSQGVQSYWFASLGRAGICRQAGVQPENLRFSAFMALPSEDKPRQISIRFIQGSPEKPTWTSTHKFEVEPMGQVVSFNLGEGKVTGEFKDGGPITIHALSFNHERFGFNRDIEFVLDDVKLEVIRP